MAVFDLYSKRKKAREEAGKPQLLKYDELPNQLRVQIIHIWIGAIGPCRWRDEGMGREDLQPVKTWSWDVWSEIKAALCRAVGSFGWQRTREILSSSALSFSSRLTWIVPWTSSS